MRVTGSDLKESRYSRALIEAGVPVFIGHDAANVGDPEVVVVSSAIPDNNPELLEARRRDIEVWPRARMLAHVAADRKTVAVAGTHGKTSTSSMIATMMLGMGLDPTFLIGGEIDGLNTNASPGGGPHYVVEADESDGSFVHLSPSVAVITNIEADHLDHYASLTEILAAFEAFIARIASDGAVVVCADDEPLVALARESGRRVVTYGFAPTADVVCSILGADGIGSRFAVACGGVTVEATVGVPGDHMVSNATGALACAWTLDLDLERAASALSGFTGVRRRFDRVGEAAGVTVVDDYAHHPTEITATLRAASALGFGRVWAIFQPHRYSRTLAFSREFGAALTNSDRLVLTDVYSAGEAPIPGVSGKTLLRSALEAAPHAHVAYLPHRGDIVPYLSRNVRPGDLVLTLGAGDVTVLGPEIVATLAERDA